MAKYPTLIADFLLQRLKGTKPAEYQNIGILNGSDTNDVKPLYERRVFRGSNLWNYYTALDSHLSTKIPIQKNRNCVDTHGCSEMYFRNAQQIFRGTIHPSG